MKVGQVGWIDLTVDKAEELRDFYASVIGWTPSPVDMDGYFDYSMKDPHGDDVAGVCHPNKWSVPETLGRWIPYFVVADMDASLAKCADLGGKVLTAPTPTARVSGARFRIARA